MSQTISIMCPNCGKFLTKAKADDNKTHKLACQGCKKWIWFTPDESKDSEIKEIPRRTTSGGKRFY